MLEKGGAKPSATEYMLQQVIFVVPAGERSATWPSASARPRPCARASTAATRTREFAKGLIDVTVRDLGRMLAPQLPPDWAEQIKATKLGGATAVRETERGVEFIGICSSREVSDDQVAQMVFQSEGGGDKDADELSARNISTNCARKPRSSSAETGIAVREAELPLALSVGDPSGIGPEIAIAAWQAARRLPRAAPSICSPIRR